MKSPINIATQALTALLGETAEQKQRGMLPTNMPTHNRPANLGIAMDDNASRLDGVAKVTGKAKYSLDMYLDNLLHVAFVRCPYAKAKLTGVNEAAAKSVPGVLEVNMTGESGTYHGQNVGYIVAESKHALRRGLRALAPQWQLQKDFKLGITDADADAKLEDDARAALQGADHPIRATYETPVQTHAALETHGVVVDHRGDQATVYATTQGTFSVLDGITDPLGLPSSKVEVVCEYVGGGFGAKFGPGKEGITAAEVSKKYKRPVMLFCNREEEHLDTGNRPSSRSDVAVGVKRDGTLAGGRIHTIGGVGVAGGGGGVRFPSERYRFDGVEKSHQDVSFNAGAPRAMRAPGFPQGAFAEELFLDEIAAATRIDPLDLRLKLDPEEDRRKMYQHGAKLIGWSNRRPNGEQTGAIRRGYGMGSSSWGAFPGEAECEVIIHRDGSVETKCGSQDIGTGYRTIMAIVTAETLGVPLDRVTSHVGRSSLPEGPASGGSVTSHNTAPAMRLAAEQARKKVLDVAAKQIDANADELELRDGHIYRNGEPMMDFAEACQHIEGDRVSGRGQWNQRSRQRHSEVWADGHSHGAQFVVVDVDTETGVIHVRDVVAIQACGKAIMRKTVESQIIGGVIGGLSFALFEDRILDRTNGAMVNANLEWYKIAGPNDMPHIRPVLWKAGEGVRSLGEPPVIPTAGAIACALYNAIGVPVRSLPLTPRKVLNALETHSASASAEGGAA